MGEPEAAASASTITAIGIEVTDAKEKNLFCVFRVINCTPHSITVCKYKKEEERKFTIPISDWCVRLLSTKENPEERFDIMGLGTVGIVKAPKSIDVIGMPPEEYNLPSTAIIVSLPVGEFLKEYPTRWLGPVIGPDTGPDAVIRDSATGQIIGTKRMVMYKKSILKRYHHTEPADEEYDMDGVKEAKTDFY
jgi:hypothetical protein